MAYLLDSDVFIEAKNRHYGFDFCPAFWDWLLAANAAGQVFSIDEVGDELRAGNDELATWAKALDATFFLTPDAAVINSLAATSAWAVGSGFGPAAVATFLAAADYDLIARCHSGGHTVVTHETFDAAATKRIKIPVACKALGVTWMTPYRMLQAEGARFVLEP